MWSDMDNDEVIGIEIDKVVWFGKAAIDRVRSKNKFDGYHTRAVFRFMAMMDLGPKWGQYADYAPTLFLRSEVE